MAIGGVSEEESEGEASRSLIRPRAEVSRDR